MDVYDQIAVRIIQSQEAIIGPVAVEQATHIEGLTLDWDKHEAKLGADKAGILQKLIQTYKDLFGHISVEVSKEAAGSLMQQLPASSLPELLK